MSADDGHIVSKIHGEDNAYGIFYEFRSADNPPDWYTRENAMQVWTHPVAAILHAHRIESIEYTEYGVYVNAAVLKDAENYFRPEGWRERKNYGPC